MIRAKRGCWLAGIALWLGLSTVAAAPAIAYLGVFNGKAVFLVDGKREVLAPGDSSVHGYTLRALNASEASIEIDGQRLRVLAGATLGSDGSHSANPLSAPSRQEVKIFPDSRGMYFVQGRINNQSVQFLVDTGATTVSLSSEMARRLGIDYRHGQAATAATASGVSQGYMVTLPKVDVGMVSIANVEAMVLEGSYPPMALLGNSFLEKVEMNRDGVVMTLRRRY